MLNVARSMGKWKPNDDYLLIQSVLNLSNLRDVFNLTNFANEFTLKELEERWYAILHDAPISRLIIILTFILNILNLILNKHFVLA